MYLSDLTNNKSNVFNQNKSMMEKSQISKSQCNVMFITSFYYILIVVRTRRTSNVLDTVLKKNNNK